MGLTRAAQAGIAHVPMCRPPLLRRAVFVTLALLAACTRPVPGVLTLAPAGMRKTGACTAHPDGTLSMQAGAAVDSVIYVDAGTVTITVTAAIASGDQPAPIEVWLAAHRIGGARVESTELQPYPFHAEARTSGPTALRLTFVDQPGGSAAGTVHVEKVVITEP